MLVVAPLDLPPPAAGRSGFSVRVPAVAMMTAIDGDPWQIEDGGRTRTIVPDIRLRLSSLLMIRDVVRAGAGVAMLPRSMLREDISTGRLAVWGRVPDRTVEVWILHSSRRLVSPKVAAFIRFMSDAFPDRVL